MAWQHAIPFPGSRARERPERHCRLPLKRSLAPSGRDLAKSRLQHALPAPGCARRILARGLPFLEVFPEALPWPYLPEGRLPLQGRLPWRKWGALQRRFRQEVGSGTACFGLPTPCAGSRISAARAGERRHERQCQDLTILTLAVLRFRV